MTDPTTHKSIPENIFAYTGAGTNFPGYVSVNRLPNGDVSVTVRAAGEGPKNGVRVCRHKKDAGPDDCYAGGPTCNNYCNMAPGKGPMQADPEKIEFYTPGVVAEFTLPEKDWTLR